MTDSVLLHQRNQSSGGNVEIAEEPANAATHSSVSLRNGDAQRRNRIDVTKLVDFNLRMISEKHGTAPAGGNIDGSSVNKFSPSRNIQKSHYQQKEKREHPTTNEEVRLERCAENSPAKHRLKVKQQNPQRVLVRLHVWQI